MAENIQVPILKERVANMILDQIDVCNKCFRISRGLEFPDNNVQNIKRLPENDRLYTQANSLDETLQSIRQIIVIIEPLLSEKIGHEHNDVKALEEIMTDIEEFLKHLIEIDLTHSVSDDLIKKVERKYESAITRWHLTPKFFDILKICEDMYSEVCSILWRNGILSHKSDLNRRSKLNEL